MLLHHKAGATSYEDLRTVDGHIHETFQGACLQLGLITDDREIHHAMNEAAHLKFGKQLRYFFATLLIYCRPPDPLNFWETWKLELCRDLMHKYHATELTPAIEAEVLLHLQTILEHDNLDLTHDFGLPTPDEGLLEAKKVPRLIQEETNYDTAALTTDLQKKLHSLTDEQHLVFNEVMHSIQQNQGKQFCLDACGGTGKTYVLNTVLTAVRAQEKIALATALSGIAATLLENGRTLHSRLKIPINIDETSTCNISSNDATAALLRRTDLIIIDEVSMGHKHIFECIDRSLQDLRNDNRPFGGITILYAGDWRQILPVVRHGSRPQIVNACLKKSYLWDKVIQLHLTKNMRTRNNETDSFAKYLIQIGNGTEPTYTHLGPDKIKLPSTINIPSQDIQHLTDFVFHDLQNHLTNPSWLASKAIIAPTNKAVDDLNNFMIHRFPGNPHEYKSCDTVLDNEHQYPLEFINKLTPSGLPPHTLILKEKCTIMLLRNFDPTNGHCNGTRYTVTKLHNHIIEATIATGPHAGKTLLIPRIPMAPSDTLYPFQMQRKQFPIRLAFAITANKSQGQTLQRVGIYLPQPMFSHGQLYVAMSRVGSLNHLKVLLCNHKNPNDGFTDNIVYKEVLQVHKSTTTPN